MTDLDILKELAQDDRSWVSERASLALQMLDQHEGGGLDEFEFQDIMNRIVASSDLDREADDIDTKAALVTAVLAAGGVI